MLYNAYFVSFFVFANSVNAISIAPIKIEFEADPGDILEDQVKFINDQNVTMYIATELDNIGPGDNEAGYPEFTGKDLHGLQLTILQKKFPQRGSSLFHLVLVYLLMLNPEGIMERFA